MSQGRVPIVATGFTCVHEPERHRSAEEATVGLIEIAIVIGMVVGPGADSTEAVVLSKVQAYAEAFRDGDVETVSGLLGAAYSHSNSSGSRPSREQWLAWFAGRAEDIREGRFAYTEYRIDDIRIHVHGDFAVATMVNTYAAIEDGEPVSGRLLLTQVWALEGGEWKRVAFHDSRIPDES